MSEEKQTPEQDPSIQDEGTQPVDLARAVQSRTGWANRTVSPWVQRALRTQTSPTGRRRGMTLTGQHTRPLVKRLQRMSQGHQRVWRPDAGSVSRQPLRFGGEIVQRHQPVGEKYRVVTAPARRGVEMPLAGGATLGEEASAPAPSMPSPLLSSLQSSMPPSPPSFAPPTAQRVPVEPPPRRTEPLLEFGDRPRPKTERPAAQERRTRPIRPISRVEEVTPGSVQRASAPPSEPEAEDGTEEEQAPDISAMPEEEIATSLQRDAEPETAEDQEIQTTPAEAAAPPSISTEPSLPLTAQQTPTPPVPAEARPTVTARPEARTAEPATSRTERPEPPALPIAPAPDTGTVQRQEEEEAQTFPEAVMRQEEEEEESVQTFPEVVMRQEEEEEPLQTFPKPPCVRRKKRKNPSRPSPRP